MLFSLRFVSFTVVGSVAQRPDDPTLKLSRHEGMQKRLVCQLDAE